MAYPCGVNLSASFIGTIQWQDQGCNKVSFYIGTNRYTEETIVWQSVNGRPASRITGRNLNKLAAELDFSLSEGPRVWLECNEQIFALLDDRA